MPLKSALEPAPVRLSAPVTASDGLTSFAVGRAATLGLALVPLLLAASDRELEFDSAVFEVHACGDQRKSLLLCLSDQFADLFPMHKQLASAQSGVVRIAAMFIGTDVAVQEPEFSVLDEAIGVFQVSL